MKMRVIESRIMKMRVIESRIMKMRVMTMLFRARH